MTESSEMIETDQDLMTDIGRRERDLTHRTVDLADLGLTLRTAIEDTEDIREDTLTAMIDLGEEIETDTGEDLQAHHLITLRTKNTVIHASSHTQFPLNYQISPYPVQFFKPFQNFKFPPKPSLFATNFKYPNFPAGSHASNSNTILYHISKSN